MLPVLSFLLTYCFSSKQGKLKFFRKHLTNYYSDWMLVLFNFLLVFSIAFSIKWCVILFCISVVLNLLMHKHYSKVIAEENKGSHFYDIELKKWTYSGIVHFIFSTIQTTLILMFLMLSVNSYFTYIEGAILILFLLCMLFTSRKMNGKIPVFDLVEVIAGIVLTLARTLYLVFIS